MEALNETAARMRIRRPDDPTEWEIIGYALSFEICEEYFIVGIFEEGDDPVYTVYVDTSPSEDVCRGRVELMRAGDMEHLDVGPIFDPDTLMGLMPPRGFVVCDSGCLWAGNTIH